jgi:SAM-dependent methyltransferase
MDIYHAYDAFADIYNRYWGRFVAGIVPTLDRLLLDDLRHGARVLDLCCGTGQLAGILLGRGFQVTGVDGSSAMIGHARRNAPAATFVLADARSFTLAEPVEAVVSTFDSLNHVLSLPELTGAFGCVHRALAPGARFLFDLNMVDGYELRWRGSFGIVTDDEVIVARSLWDPDKAIGRIDLTLMSPGGDGWDRRDLTLTQRCYTEEEVRSALAGAGFVAIEVLDSAAAGHDEVGRSFFLACKPGT